MASSRETPSVTSEGLRQVRRAAKPVPGESLRGLVADTCADNSIPNTWGMLRHFGLLHRNRVDLSESPHVDIAGLATAMRIDESVVLDRIYPLVGPASRRFNGLSVPTSRIESRVRRFSPAAIAAGRLHHPATHELRDLPFSTVGWDLLQDTCPCETTGVRQGWTRTNFTHRCDACGARLSRIPPVMVDENHRASLELLAGLVDRDPAVQKQARLMVPPAIRDANGIRLYDTIIYLTRYIGAPVPRSGADVRKEQVGILARACEAVIAWPQGIAAITASADCPTYVRDRVRTDYMVLDGSDAFGSRTASGFQGVAPNRPCETPGPTGTIPATRQGRATTRRDRPGLSSAMAISKLVGIDEPALKQAWDEGRLTQHRWVRGGEYLRAFDEDEVRNLAPALRVTKARGMVAARFGMPIYGIEQLIASKLVDPGAAVAETDQATLHMQAADDLVRLLTETSQVAIEDPIILIEAIRHVSGRPKPWAAVIGHLIDGAVPFTVDPTAAKKVLVRKLLVPKAAIPKIAAMRIDDASPSPIKASQGWSQFDSIECLNGYKNTTSVLAGIASTGNRPKVYSAASVIDRAEIGVTTSDLARRSGMSIIGTYDALVTAGVTEIAPALWNRAHAENLLSL